MIFDIITGSIAKKALIVMIPVLIASLGLTGILKYANNSLKLEKQELIKKLEDCNTSLTSTLDAIKMNHIQGEYNREYIKELYRIEEGKDKKDENSLNRDSVDELLDLLFRSSRLRKDSSNSIGQNRSSSKTSRYCNR